MTIPTESDAAVGVRVRAVLDERSDEVAVFVAQYRGARPGSVARFVCDLVDAVDRAAADNVGTVRSPRSSRDA